MTEPFLGDALLTARKQLQNAGIETSALDARLLLQEATGLTHADIILHDKRQLTTKECENFKANLIRRTLGEPVSRIIGNREFYGRLFKVTPSVLDPRADTEALITLCLRHAKRGAYMLDLGTGSGILLLTLLLETESTAGVAVDLSRDALSVASHNADVLGLTARAKFQHSNWFENVTEKFDLIVSNPPYIVAGDIERLAKEVKDHDPSLALNGGSDGLDAYRAIAGRATVFLNPQAAIAVEIGATQESDVVKIFASHCFHCIDQERDISGQLRALLFTL